MTTFTDEAAWRRRANEKVLVRLRGGPGDGQVFYFIEPPSFITYGLDFGQYLRVPTDGTVVEYRFVRHEEIESDETQSVPLDASVLEAP